jgi:hypothetical protein
MEGISTVRNVFRSVVVGALALTACGGGDDATPADPVDRSRAPVDRRH